MILIDHRESVAEMWAEARTPRKPERPAMTAVSYDPRMDMIRADLAPDAWPVEVHAGPAGRSFVVRLTRAEAVRLLEQLEDATRRADRAEALRYAGGAVAAE
jgi:hypothetical protein